MEYKEYIHSLEVKRDNYADKLSTATKARDISKYEKLIEKINSEIADINYCAEFLLSGGLLGELVDFYGVSPSTLYARFRRYRINVKKMHNIYLRMYWAEHHKEIIAEYQKGTTIKELSEKHPYTVIAIERLLEETTGNEDLRDFGETLEFDLIKRKNQVAKTLDKEQIDKVLQLLEEGNRIKEIGIAMQLPQITVVNIINHINKNIRNQ